jgi:small subunit ribosomal protein S5
MANITAPPEGEGGGEGTERPERPERPRGRGGRGGPGGRGGRGRGRESRESREGQPREEPDLVDRLVSINRVAKVVKGGRRFAFAALVVVGDGKGRVGYGTGKAREVPEAIRKATDQAKRAMIRVPLRDRRTLHHDLVGRYGAGRVVLRAADPGTGIIAGGPMRAVFETMGVHDVVAKSVGTANPHNMVKATFAALKYMMSPRVVAARRGKKVGDLVGRRGEVGPGDKD